MSDLKLQVAQLAQSGRRQEALDLVRNHVQQHPQDIDAWWLLANIVNNPKIAHQCLDRILQLDPTHAKALKMLAEMDSAATPPPSTPPPAPKPASSTSSGGGSWASGAVPVISPAFEAPPPSTPSLADELAMALAVGSAFTFVPSSAETPPVTVEAVVQTQSSFVEATQPPVQEATPFAFIAPEPPSPPPMPAITSPFVFDDEEPELEDFFEEDEPDTASFGSPLDDEPDIEDFFDEGRNANVFVASAPAQTASPFIFGAPAEDDAPPMEVFFEEEPRQQANFGTFTAPAQENYYGFPPSYFMQPPSIDEFFEDEAEVPVEANPTQYEGVYQAKDNPFRFKVPETLAEASQQQEEKALLGGVKPLSWEVQNLRAESKALGKPKVDTKTIDNQTAYMIIGGTVVVAILIAVAAFFLVGSDKEGLELTQTASNEYYTLKYPDNWFMEDHGEGRIAVASRSMNTKEFDTWNILVYGEDGRNAETPVYGFIDYSVAAYAASGGASFQIVTMQPIEQTLQNVIDIMIQQSSELFNLPELAFYDISAESKSERITIAGEPAQFTQFKVDFPFGNVDGKGSEQLNFYFATFVHNNQHYIFTCIAYSGEDIDYSKEAKQFAESITFVN